MKHKLTFMAAIPVIFMIFNGLAEAGNQPPVEGGALPEIVLPVPESPELQEYLGISGRSSFTISKIKAEVVLIEIFSMY